MPTTPRKQKMEKLRSEINTLDFKAERNILSACVNVSKIIQKEKRLAQLEKSYQSSQRDGN